MQWGGLFFGILTLGAVLSTLNQRPPTKRCGVVLAAMWIICMAVTLTVGYGLADVIGTGLDLIAGTYVAFLWAKYPRNWIIILAVTFAAQLAAHSAYHDGPKTYPRAYALALEINLIYVIQLCLLTLGPRAHVGVHFLQDLLSGFGPRYRRRHDLAARAERGRR